MDIEKCRERAAECLKRAQSATDAAEKADWLSMAEFWAECSRQYEARPEVDPSIIPAGDKPGRDLE